MQYSITNQNMYRPLLICKGLFIANYVDVKETMVYVYVPNLIANFTTPFFLCWGNENFITKHHSLMKTQKATKWDNCITPWSVNTVHLNTYLQIISFEGIGTLLYIKSLGNGNNVTSKLHLVWGLCTCLQSADSALLVPTQNKHEDPHKVGDQSHVYSHMGVT